MLGFGDWKTIILSLILKGICQSLRSIKYRKGQRTYYRHPHLLLKFSHMALCLLSCLKLSPKVLANSLNNYTWWFGQIWHCKDKIPATYREGILDVSPDSADSKAETSCKRAKFHRNPKADGTGKRVCKDTYRWPSSSWAPPLLTAPSVDWSIHMNSTNDSIISVGTSHPSNRQLRLTDTWYITTEKKDGEETMFGPLCINSFLH